MVYWLQICHSRGDTPNLEALEIVQEGGGDDAVVDDGEGDVVGVGTAGEGALNGAGMYPSLDDGTLEEYHSYSPCTPVADSVREDAAAAVAGADDGTFRVDAETVAGTAASALGRNDLVVHVASLVGGIHWAVASGTRLHSGVGTVERTPALRGAAAGSQSRLVAPHHHDLDLPLFVLLVPVHVRRHVRLDRRGSCCCAPLLQVGRDEIWNDMSATN